MLLQLAVENFKSIHDQVIFSMLATNDTLHHDYKRKIGPFEILPSSVIIGTNGAGKSNLFMAFKYLQSLLKKDTHDIHAFPHLLSSKDKPTQIDIQFMLDNERIAYGADVMNNQVVSEYCYRFKNNKQIILYERKLETYQIQDDYKEQFNEIINKHGAKSHLLLPLLSKYTNDSLIDRIYRFLTERIIVVLADDEKDQSLLMKAIHNFKEIENQKRLRDLMGKMDIGIEGFVYEEGTVYVQYHNMKISISEESAGTKKLFSLLVLLSDALNEGKIVVFDELEKNLHEPFVFYLIHLFNDKMTNQNNAQLLFSTHNTSFLDLKHFRRDQIWFMEKDLQKMTTECYSLYNIVDVNETEDIQKGYILGKYGATFKFSHGGVKRHEK